MKRRQRPRTFWEIFSASIPSDPEPGIPGKKRRDWLLRQIIRRNGAAINCKWGLTVYQDPDLKKLMNKGLVKTVREPRAGRCKRTLVVPA